MIRWNKGNDSAVSVSSPPQSREQEMGDRVWQVQKELEELQEKSRSSAEVN